MILRQTIWETKGVRSIWHEGFCEMQSLHHGAQNELSKTKVLQCNGCGFFAYRVEASCLQLKIILTTPTPHISKKYDPKICHKMRGRMAYKSLEIKGLSQRMWCTNRLLRHTNSDFYGVRTPLLCHMNRFYWGWAWSLICWTVELLYLQLTIVAFLLTVGALLLTVLAFLLTVGAFLLTMGKCV